VRTSKATQKLKNSAKSKSIEIGLELCFKAIHKSLPVLGVVGVYSKLSARRSRKLLHRIFYVILVTSSRSALEETLYSEYRDTVLFYSSISQRQMLYFYYKTYLPYFQCLISLGSREYPIRAAVETIQTKFTHTGRLRQAHTRARWFHRAVNVDYMFLVAVLCGSSHWHRQRHTHNHTHTPRRCVASTVRLDHRASRSLARGHARARSQKSPSPVNRLEQGKLQTKAWAESEIRLQSDIHVALIWTSTAAVKIKGLCRHTDDTW
jgi:hypothetical protein